MNKCLTCGNATENPKFCSKSCAITTNNKLFPKRTTKKRCIICGDSVKSYRHNRCESHWLLYQEDQKNSLKSKTVGELTSKLSVRGKHPSWKSAEIRNFARSWNKDLVGVPCQKCGYKFHTELCHIKAINSFDDTALLGEINSPSNILVLCPNCHWEFDHGFLFIPK